MYQLTWGGLQAIGAIGPTTSTTNIIIIMYVGLYVIHCTYSDKAIHTIITHIGPISDKKLKQIK